MFFLLLEVLGSLVHVISHVFVGSWCMIAQVLFLVIQCLASCIGSLAVIVGGSMWTNLYSECEEEGCLLNPNSFYRDGKIPLVESILSEEWSLSHMFPTIHEIFGWVFTCVIVMLVEIIVVIFPSVIYLRNYFLWGLFRSSSFWEFLSCVISILMPWFF